MGDVLYHSKSSAKLFGGIPEDYMEIHKYMDDTKSHIADWRHRLLRHNSMFIDESERIFGIFWTRKSDNEKVSTRTIVSQHIVEDLGFIPSVGDWLRELPLKNWMNGVSGEQRKRMQKISIEADSDNRLLYVNSKTNWLRSNTPPKKGFYLVGIDGEPTKFAYWDKISWTNLETKKLIPLKSILYYAEKPSSPVSENLEHKEL